MLWLSLVFTTIYFWVHIIIDILCTLLIITLLKTFDPNQLGAKPLGVKLENHCQNHTRPIWYINKYMNVCLLLTFYYGLTYKESHNSYLSTKKGCMSRSPPFANIGLKFANWTHQTYIIKVNSLQESCAKYIAVHILKFEILQITWKKWNKEHKTPYFQFFNNRFSILMFFCFFFSCGLHDFKFW
jgi:hypothetical protein